MKVFYVMFLSIVIGCNANAPQNETSVESDTVNADDQANPNDDSIETAAPIPKVYSNERFKDVTVERLAEHKFLIRGKGQIFEASFNWVVEDGHEELKQGFQMTDAGAPEWGNFNFTLDVEKRRENSILTLILFESSPEDGSRQHELPVFLY